MKYTMRVLVIIIALWCDASVKALQQIDGHPGFYVDINTVAGLNKRAAEDANTARYIKSVIAKAAAMKIETLKTFDYSWLKEEMQQKDLLKRDRGKSMINNNAIPRSYTSAALELGRAHLFDPNGGFGEKGKQVLLALSEYKFLSDDINRGLDYGTVSVEALKAYDILYPLFTELERQKMRDFFDRLVESVKSNNDYWVKYEPGGAMNNHFGWHSACFFGIGLFFDRPELVERALYGSHGFTYALENGFQDDGLWREGSLPYQFVQVTSMLEMAQMARNTKYKVDLFSYKTADGRTLKQAFDWVFGIMFPDASVPPIGDGYGRIVYPGKNACYETLYKIYGDPNYAWLLRTVPYCSLDPLIFSSMDYNPKALIVQDMAISGRGPSQVSRLWYEHGYAALRTVDGPQYWTGDGYTLFATFATNRTHNHCDKLSVMLYGDGHLWLRDAEAAPTGINTFGSSVNQVLNCATLSHNTVMVDYNSQFRRPAKRLEMLEYAVLPDAKYITMADLQCQLYPGVRQVRKCIVTKDYVLDVFQVASDSQHQFSWVTHIDANDSNNSDQQWQTQKLAQQDGAWAFIRNAKTNTPSKVFNESYTFEDKQFEMDVTSDKAFVVTKCGFPRSDAADTSYMPMRMLSCTDTNAVFIAVYRSGKHCGKPARIDFNDAPMGMLEVLLTIDGKEYRHKVLALKSITK